MVSFTINRKLILIKLHYFLFNAGVAPLMTFGSTIARQIGFAAVTVGFMYTVLPLASLFFKIFSAAIADKYKLRKLIFFITVLVCFISSLCMTFLNTSVSANEAFLLCHQEVYLNSCKNRISESQIMKIRRSNYSKSSIECKMFCQSNSKFNEELCSTWKVDSFCSKPRVNNELHDYNAVKYNFIPDSKSTTVFQQKTKYKPTNIVNLTFTSVLLKKHINVVNDCLYATISRIIFPTSNRSIIPYCNERMNISCSVICDDTQFNNIIKINENTWENDFKKLEFWIFFLIYTVFWCSTLSVNSFSDTVCFDLLENEPQKYGIQRMFGASGWGITSLCSGWLVDYFSNSFISKNYNILFYMGAGILILDLFIIFHLKVEQKVTSLSVYKDVKILFYSFKTVVFTFWCILTGILMGISWQFLFWHLEDISNNKELEWIKTIQGLDSLFSTVIGELPFFFISGWIINKCGYINLMSIVLFACTIRMFMYSILTAPLWVLPIELLSGFTFSICYVVVASYSSLITISGTESTVQALFGAMFDGLGISLGGLLGGIIYHYYNGHILFASLGYICGIAFILHLCVHSKLKNTPQSNIQNVNGTSAHYMTPNDGISILERS